MKFFNLLRLVGIDIVQATMSVSTLYFFTFSSYMKKNMFTVRAQITFPNTNFSNKYQNLGIKFMKYVNFTSSKNNREQNPSMEISFSAE